MYMFCGSLLAQLAQQTENEIRTIKLMLKNIPL